MNICSSCNYKKVCSESNEKDGFEYCEIKNRKKIKTEKQKVIETGRY